jgi:hypothetical protein
LVERFCRGRLPPSQQIERSVDGGAVKVTADIPNRSFHTSHAQKHSLGNILRIGHAARDAIGCDEDAPVMLCEELGEAFR